MKNSYLKKAGPVVLALLFSGCAAMQDYAQKVENFNNNHPPVKVPGYVPVWQYPVHQF